MARSRRPIATPLCVLFAAGFVLSLASPAMAVCSGSRALDRCLLGTWNYANGGSAQWMNRNIHGVRVSHISHNGINMTFRADGSFATGAIDVHAAVVARSGAVSGTGHATGQASGEWSVAGGRFNLCSTASNVQTAVTVNVHGHLIHVTPHMPTAPTSINYTCSATTLTTSQPIAGHEPIVTVYARAH